MACEKIDHKALAISRLATQFRESANLIAYIKALLNEANTLEDVHCSLIERRTIDTATGVNLDIIGAIVGQSREQIDAEIFHYFGFSPHPQANSFGSSSDPSVGGRWRKSGESITGIRLLTDEEYRVFIRARITRNYTSVTAQEVIDALQFIFEDLPVLLVQSGIAAYQLSFGRELTLNEIAILKDTDIIPRPAGVQVSYVAIYNPVNFFAFGSSNGVGIPNARGFGSSNGVGGGQFASSIF